MIVGIFILFGLYFLCILALIIGFRKIPIFSLKAVSPVTEFSVVIPFRNEAKNLPLLLESLSKLNYPSQLFEIILVDDFSEDNSIELIHRFQRTSNLQIRLIRNKHISNSPKKDAILLAIQCAAYEWIVTSDADCSLPENWLSCLDGIIQCENAKINRPVMICGSIVYTTNKSMVQDFQYFDGLSLQAVTIGSFGLRNPLLSNGANLAYRKDAFEKVNGFTGNNHIASGDDIFLMEKIKRTFPNQIKFLKSHDNMVKTRPQSSWKSLINQRVRWASKTAQQNNPASFLLGLLVFAVNLVFLLLPIFIILNPESWVIYFVLVCFKIILDFIAIKQVEVFFRMGSPLYKFPLMPFLYAGITVLVVIKSFKGGYQWKNRAYSNPPSF